MCVSACTHVCACVRDGHRQRNLSDCLTSTIPCINLMSASNISLTKILSSRPLLYILSMILHPCQLHSLALRFGSLHFTLLFNPFFVKRVEIQHPEYEQNSSQKYERTWIFFFLQSLVGEAALLMQVTGISSVVIILLPTAAFLTM